MRPRPIVPPGKAGLLILAAATVPILISRCKPLAKRMGEKMVEWGEKLKTEAAKTPEPEEKTSETQVDEAEAAACAVAEPVVEPEEAVKPKPKAAPKKTATKSTAKPKAKAKD